MHIANFLASPHSNGEDMDQEAASDSSFSSSFDSLDDDDSFITSEFMCDDEDEDESLQDTACSSAAWPKVRKKEDSPALDCRTATFSPSYSSNIIMVYCCTDN